MKRPMCWLCLLFLAGIWLGDLTGIMPVRENPSVLPQEENGQAVIYGRIYQYNYSENSTGIWLKDVYLESHIRKNSINGKEKKMKPIPQTIVYLQEECDGALPLGTWVQAQGKLTAIDGPRNPGEFDSRLYFQTKKIYYRMSGRKMSVYKRKTWRMREGMRRIREKLTHSLERAAPGQAGILCAMVTGEKSLLEQEEKNRLAAGSLSHMISISGMHLGLLGMFLFWLLQKMCLSIRPASVVAVGVMLLYGMLTGENVATMRALGMFGLAMVAKAAGRSYDLLSALSLSVILILLDNPVYLYYSGFLLSCGCICAVGLVLPQLGEIIPIPKGRGTFWKNFSQACQMGIAVQITTLPLVAWFYYEIPLYGILVNLLAAPTLAITLASGILGAVVGMWQVALARVLLLPGCLLVDFYLFLCETVKKLPHAVLIVGQPEKWQMALYYGALAAGFFTVKRIKSGRMAGAALFLAFWFTGTVLMCWRGHESLEITCLDVGQGDGAVIQSPQGECYLVDGGSSSQSKVGQYRILPFLKSQGISQIDVAFISHADADHVNGIEEILKLIQTGQTSMKIRCLALPGLEEKEEGQEKIATLAKRAGVAVQYLNAGDRVQGEEIVWRAVSPLVRGQAQDINENSLALFLECESFRGMFTGDMGEEQETRITGYLTECDFLKVAHHGSKHSTGNRFLRKVRPKIAVASSSAANTYGHPHPDTLKRLEENRCHAFLTKDSGAVNLKVKDDAVEVNAYLREAMEVQ